jgi:GTP-binding protein Era
VSAKSEEPVRSGTVAIVGRPNVGKSTLLNAALGQPLAIVSPVPQTTRHRVLGVVHRRSAEIILLDTPGMHRPMSRLGRALNRTARAASEEADVVLFVMDAKAGIHAGDRTLLADIGAAVPTLLVLNKVDLVGHKGKLLPIMAEVGTLRDFAAIVPISAMGNDGVDRLLDEVVRHLPEAPHRFDRDAVTDMPARFFAAELVREQVLLATRKEVPHACAVQIDAFEERAQAYAIEATILVEREGQKKIVIGKGGAMLKDIGQRARERIAEMMGRPVHLKLWVKVSPDWTDSPGALGDLGYEEGR